MKSASRRPPALASDAERKLWSMLRGRRLLGLQFQRQQPMLGFVVSFFCAQARLVIELDGPQYFETTALEELALRDLDLRKLGLRVLRFDEFEVLRESGKVLESIVAHLKAGLAAAAPNVAITS